MATCLAHTLHAAAGAGDLDAVRSWVARGAAVNARDDRGGTPLLMSVLRGHWAVAAYLVSQGADPHASDYQGVSPLSLLQALVEGSGP